ncbi:hypothetical protein [Mesorhizobium sp. WSM3876]|uniref:hypothetical protein n=1 Tax=Mesorhizobium sp. WSM3876 TaxID=422277 RepID=UPI000BAF309B|nr:hypothetical protein [Mesorhizobium sp. WSM3876]PBB83571.1 hypothetical protein CK216_27835 [Mesorhizobium sp. WSM3876]
MALADDIAMVQGHVALGRRHIAQQRERIGELERLELPTERAFELLDLFESMQDLHERHLSRLLAKAEERGLDTAHRLQPQTHPLAFSVVLGMSLVSERPGDQMMAELLNKDVPLVVNLGHRNGIPIELYPVRVSLRCGFEKQPPRTIYARSRMIEQGPVVLGLK